MSVLVSNADNMVQQNFPFRIKLYAILTIIKYTSECILNAQSVLKRLVYKIVRMSELCNLLLNFYWRWAKFRQAINLRIAIDLILTFSCVKELVLK